MVLPKIRCTSEEILQHLRTVELEAGKGLAVLDARRMLGITEQPMREPFLNGELFYILRKLRS